MLSRLITSCWLAKRTATRTPNKPPRTKIRPLRRLLRGLVTNDSPLGFFCADAVESGMSRESDGDGDADAPSLSLATRRRSMLHLDDGNHVRSRESKEKKKEFTSKQNHKRKEKKRRFEPKITEFDMKKTESVPIQAPPENHMCGTSSLLFILGFPFLSIHALLSLLIRVLYPLHNDFQSSYYRCYHHSHNNK